MPDTAPVVALLTDFGTSDVYVGVMKGVILTRCRDARIIDISHDVPPQNVRSAAFMLGASLQSLPDDAIVCAVVDPGVGTERAAVIVRDGKRLLVGPDNGTVGTVASDAAEVFRIDPTLLGVTSISATFHGRDIFAPVAGELAAGTPPEALGERRTPPVLHRIDVAFETVHSDRISGIVQHVDHFGNLITTVRAESLTSLGAPRAPLVAHVGALVAPIEHTYADVPPGAPLAYVGSSGFVEIAIRNGSAAEAADAGQGGAVRIVAAD